MRYLRDEKLEAYLSGKRVVVVGPSPHLVGLGLGSYLESYDVVCRLNEVAAVGLEADYGSRTDLAFLNCASLSIGDYIYKMREAGDVAENLKYVVCPVIRAQHDGGGSVVENSKLINIYDIPFSHIGVENYNNVFAEYGVEPNSGQVAILMLLQYPIKELFITGVSFYAQNTNEENLYDRFYHKSHTPYCLQIRAFNPRVGHQQIPQINYFVNVVLRDYADKVVIDSYLKGLLQVEYGKVVQL